jgi:hypothetical protein
MILKRLCFYVFVLKQLKNFEGSGLNPLLTTIDDNGKNDKFSDCNLI